MKVITTNLLNYFWKKGIIPIKEALKDKFDKEGGDISGSIKTNGSVNAGDKVRIWTDKEGGNVEVESPDGIRYQFDAYNEIFRLYAHSDLGNVAGFYVTKNGKVQFPHGFNAVKDMWMVGATASDGGYPGLVPTPGKGKQNAFLRGDGTWADPNIGGNMCAMQGWIGYQDSMYGYAIGYHIGNGTYVLKVQCKITSRIITGGPGASSNFDWGLNLSVILSSMGIDTAKNLYAGQYMAWSDSGALLTAPMGYATGFSQRNMEDGYKIIVPGRYYDVDAFGIWGNTSDLAELGTFYDATIIVV